MRHRLASQRLADIATIRQRTVLNLVLASQLLLSVFCFDAPSARADQIGLDTKPAIDASTDNFWGATASSAASPADQSAPLPQTQMDGTVAGKSEADKPPAPPAANPVANERSPEASGALSEPVEISKSAGAAEENRSSGPNQPDRQVATKDGANTQNQSDESAAGKEGVGGFVGEHGGEISLLEQGFVQTNARETLGEVITIDNDEALEVEETIAYEELPTDDGKTRIKNGAQFPVVMSSQISSKNAKKGDSFQARLKYDLKIGDRLVAEKGAPVYGHIDYCLPARSAMHSLVSPHRWYRNSGCIGLNFDELVNKQGEHIALNAKPARRARIVKNKGEGRVLGVNHDGQITGPWSQQLRYKAIRVGLNFALAPAGVFSFGAMPVALGVIGAANPSFAFMKPVGLNVRHRRVKGFAWGFLSGVPGSWIIEDTVIKGQEAIIKPGDEFLVELQEEFTGEARSEAQLMPGSSAKVRGQVIKNPKAKSSKGGSKPQAEKKPGKTN